MDHRNAGTTSTLRRALPTTLAAIVGLGILGLGAPLTSARATSTRPPSVPANIEVPAGHRAFLIGHAEGTQNYICLPSGGAVKFVLFTPQATLFNGDGKEIATHYFSPNPDEAGTIRPTWQHSRDTSLVRGKGLPGESSSDPAYVAPGAIAWLLIRVAGTQDGPQGGSIFANTSFLQRVNTSGGAAPATGCASSDDIGHQAFVPYTADYYFYKPQ
jgi:hypothetical protein